MIDLGRRNLANELVIGFVLYVVVGFFLLVVVVVVVDKIRRSKRRPLNRRGVVLNLILIQLARRGRLKGINSSIPVDIGCRG